MDSQFRDRIETIFHASRDRAAGAERQAYLDGACGGDAELRSRADALLAADESASDFMEGPAVEAQREGPGASIGPYKLLQEIGEGGMGVVYMAEQLKPVARKVALKVIKLGMDTKQVIARFEAERQALAMMDHPGIARVLDAGTTESGRPYFVMELVRGISISEYCDTHKLGTEERLKLFIDVCRAVQHAHQKGVIHRDLKPSNVLVTSHDGMPVPKIIDFGVAKATNRRLTERTLFTEFQQIIGTPEYMSPEQAEMSGLDVDTRSDIYALGVLLYQLLTGTTPVDPTELRTAGFEEMTRMIREKEAPAPSSRVSTLGAAAEKIAQRRGSDVGSLSRHFRGELDWIVLKALEKDRTRRYDTASAFAQDVVRHLENRPVEAGPVSAGYRMRKFVYRNQKAVAAALVFVIVVGLGLAGTTSGFLRARAEAERSLTISDSLQDVLAMTDSARASDREEVEAVLATVREVFGEEHATYAAVLDTLSVRLHDAGDFATATELCRESLAVWERVHGEGHPNVAIALARLGSLLRLQGEEVEAESVLRESLALLEGAADAPGLAGYEASVELADLLANRGDYAEADELYGEALVLLRASPSTPRFRILDTLEKRFRLQMNSASEDSIDTLREIYDETHAFYPDESPLIATSALSLGRYLSQRGRQTEAEPYLREAIQGFRDADQTKGILYLAAHDGLFQILRGRKDLASVRETDELLRDTIELARPFWQGETLASNLMYLGERMLDRERYGDAVDAISDAHEALVDDGYPVEDRERVRRGLTSVALRTAVTPDLAPEAYAKARRAVERALEDEPDNPAMLAVLAATHYREGDLDVALETLDLLDEPLSRSRARMARSIAPTDHVFRALALAALGDQTAALSELEAARAVLDGQVLDAVERKMMAELEAAVEQPRSADADR
jgi:serine/threonine protein kinase/tetratricopeptide (TPR) repeat protein